MTTLTMVPLEQTEFRKGEVVRYKDFSGVSGVGVVAQIVQFSNGKIVLGWLGDFPTTNQFDSLEHFFAINGHNGATVIHWDDGDVQRRPEPARRLASSTP